MKKIVIFAIGLFSATAIAQNNEKGKVGINNTIPKATLDIRPNPTNSQETSDTNEGILIPRLSKKRLASINDSNLAESTLVYVNDITEPDTSNNKVSKVLEKGYYYYNGTEWISIKSQTTLSITTQVDYNILGYIPSTTTTATSAPTSVIYNNKTANKLSTYTYSGNGHSYATFLSDQILTWYEAYEMAKSMGGYLATFTTDDEWISVETALLNNNTTFDTVGAWIGMARFEWFAGSAMQPNPEVKWITGELPYHDYSAGGTSAIRKSHWFYTGEPNNSDNIEGFVHTFYKNIGNTKTYNGYTSYHTWNDISANNTGQNTKSFIIEFQQ